jgi:hypothetical protein
VVGILLGAAAVANAELHGGNGRHVDGGDSRRGRAMVVAVGSFGRCSGTSDR